MERMLLTENRVRNNRGAAVIGLCLALLLFLIFIIFFSFDMSRVQMAQRELTAICDAAALSGSAMITSKDTSFEDSSLDTLYTTQLAAEQYAKNMVSMGNILGMQCYDPAMNPKIANGVKLNWVGSTAALAHPAPGTCNVCVQLVSPINNYVVVPPGNSSARGVWVQASFGYIPFLHLLGVASVGLAASSTSSLQKLYVVMVFDCSGSMDDNTEVSFVYRRWSDSSDSAAVQAKNGGKGQYVYTVVGTPGNGQLWQYAGLNYDAEPNGTAVNVLPPQNLDFLGFVYGNTNFSYANSNTAFSNANPPLAFDIAIADYVPWPAGTIAGAYNAAYKTYPINGSGFQGPYYDNYFGTPPGNCTVKYGSAPSGASYGGQVAPDITNPLKSLNSMVGNTAAQLPGPGYSPGYYYYPTGAANPNDGNIYFYDPYSMPARCTSNKVVAFTDMVANITSITPPVTQPAYGPGTFTSFTESFPSASSTYTIPIGETTSQNLTETGYYEEDTTLDTVKNYPFLSLAYVVEASRGNLDLEWNASLTGTVGSTYTNFDNALLGYGSNMTLPARAGCLAGYQKAYQRLAMYVMQPYATAIDGARRFFQNLCGTSCCSFGFVGFSVTPAATASYKCAYIGTVANGETSLSLAAPANTYKPQSVYSSYVYQPLAGCNPCFWVTDNFCSPTSSALICPAGPSGSPTGEAYDAGLNTTGPSRSTWLKVAGASPPSNATSLWANNFGFEIPRCCLNTSWTQGQSYYNVAGDDWEGYIWNSAGTTTDYGCNGVQASRPMYDTDGLEALEFALYNLTNISALTTLSQGKITGLTLPADYGAKKVICFFTDGIPTDDASPFPTYTSNLVAPAQTKGVSVYSIGLALNTNIQTKQAPFLLNLANKGSNGSQEFQVTNSATLTATFCGIARQLAQGQR